METQQETLFASEAPRPTTEGAYARVAVERGIDTDLGSEGLTYRVELPPMAAPLSVGERVEVPLGRSGKLAPGIVVAVGGAELLDGLSPAKVKPIARRSGATLPPALIELARWMAGYYVCPLGMVLATMMPAAVKHAPLAKPVEVVTLRGAALLPGAPEADAPKLKPAARRLLEQIAGLPPGTFPIPIKQLSIKLGLRGPQRLRRLAAAGALDLSISDQATVPVDGEAAPAYGGRAPDVSTPPQPTPDQQAAIDGIAPTLGRFHVHLLRGITGSGKTEVYLRLIARVIEQGKSAIVLVPEIALTPQTADRFTRRFGQKRVAVLHSGLTGSQRRREWSRAAGGHAQVIVGARSAIFAPVPHLGLVVVDEEHDSSYKQDRLPRYNGRDVAIKRAQVENAPIILGSATPSLESWHNANSGSAKWSLWHLTTRIGNARLPRVEIVDMAEQRRSRIHSSGGDDGRLHLLGPTLESALEKTINDGAQAILLLNRRGFAHYICCPKPACGFVLGCEQCDATLILHRHSSVPSGQFVRCHHCLNEQVVPRLCPSCGTRLNVFGGGTQRAEDELLRKFASMGLVEGQSLLRLDSDSMRTARDYYDALDRFASGQVRVLLGTQMIAKGLDFPNVRLVGVIDADTGLNIPDFRSSERTFQLITQVAGRAGRSDHPGRVIVQTFNPRNGAIQLAATHDYLTFAAQELATRTRAKLPPVSRMAHIVCRDESDAKARAAAQQLADSLRGAAPEGSILVRGPAPCAVSRIAGHYRYAVDVTAPRAGILQQILAATRAAGLLKSDAKTAVDVDPVALM
jgi:primosomal protein N' (replication factor Y)